MSRNTRPRHQYGGVVQFIDQYDGRVAGFVARADQFADQFADQIGERLRPLTNAAARG
jgi:hypothetical protein